MEETPILSPTNAKKAGLFGRLTQIASKPKPAEGSPIATSENRKTKTKKGERNSKRNSKETDEEIDIYLSQSELAFLPKNVRELILKSAKIPKAPDYFGSKGCVLFVDISGFTALGQQLRSEFSPLEAAGKLALRIGKVLRELASEVENYEGDVVKFAGDALLCVWERDDLFWATTRAKACAIAMLKLIKDIDSHLDLHGGIATGSLMHIHLGPEQKNDLRWYLMTGDAVLKATDLVDDAKRGTILFCKPTDGSVEILTGEMESHLVMTRMHSANELTVMDEGKEVSRVRTDTQDDPFLNLKIPSLGRAYIPKTLRTVLSSGKYDGEMRTRVSIIFCSMDELTMTSEEFESGTVSPEKLKLLNSTFCSLVDITHSLEGEVRDLLFDDKGCIFIAVFGAYRMIDLPELKAVKAAKRFTEELDTDCQVGVSCGTCFVGLAGDDRRHDFVVMGHEVNMSARYMGKAEIGQVLVSPTIVKQTEDFYEYKKTAIMLKKGATEEAKVELNKSPPLGVGNSARQMLKQSSTMFRLKDVDLAGETEGNGNAFPGEVLGKQSQTDNVNGMAEVHILNKSITRRPSYLASYRYPQHLHNVFVGRKAELKKMEQGFAKAVKDKAGVVSLIEGPRGFGKSAFVTQLRAKNDEKFLFALGTAFELEQQTPFYVFKQILESLFGIFEQMKQSRIKALMGEWEKQKIVPSAALLKRVIPYIEKLLEEKEEVRREEEAVELPPPKPNKRMSIMERVSVMLMPSTSGRNLAGDSSRNLNGETGLRELSGGEGVDPMGASPSIRQSSAGSHVSAMRLDEQLVNKRASTLIESVITFGQSTLRMSMRGAKASANAGDEVAKKDAGKDAKKQSMRKRKNSVKQSTLGPLGGRELVEISNMICGLIGLAAESAKAQKKSVVLVVEDLQWLDINSLQMVEILVDQIVSKQMSNVQMILTTRDVSSITAQSNIQSISKLMIESIYSKLNSQKGNPLNVQLDVLSREECDSVFSAVLQQSDKKVSLSKSLLDDLYKNTGGMPYAICNVIEIISPIVGDAKTSPFQVEGNQLKWRAGLADTVLSQARMNFISRIDNISLESKEALKICACCCAPGSTVFKISHVCEVLQKDLENKSRYGKAQTNLSILTPTALSKLLRGGPLHYGFLKYSRNLITANETWSFASTAVQEALLDMVPKERREELEGLKSKIDTLQAEDIAQQLLTGVL